MLQRDDDQAPLCPRKLPRLIVRARGSCQIHPRLSCEAIALGRVSSTLLLRRRHHAREWAVNRNLAAGADVRSSEKEGPGGLDQE